MVQINVSQQLKAPIGTKRIYKINEAVNIAGNERLVQGKVEMMRIDRSILIKGRLETTVELTCSRCLNLFSYPLTLNIEEEFFSTTDVVTGLPVTVSGEPGCFTIDENNILDLAEAIRQYTVMATPMKPLCSKDCFGLCPTCGSNLNREPCNCPPGDIDPRWSKLQEFFLANNQEPVNEQKGMK